ncbi:MAG: OpgC domain-containing protein [bacterium]
MPNRDHLIDSLRGLMLIIMTIDHTPLFIRRYTYGLFGLFTAAIGFIFISGYLFGLVYSKYICDTGVLKSKTYKRIWLIYKYHIGIFLIVFILNYFFQFVTYKGEMIMNFDKLYTNPQRVIKFFLLLRQPGYFDILPLYMVLLFLSPLILLGFQKGYREIILVSSFVIWITFQLTFTQNIYESLQSRLSINLGHFNLFSWQFLFITALFFGFQKRVGGTVVRYNKKLVLISFYLALLIFLFRHIDPKMGWGLIKEIMEKDRITYLSPIHLISFFIVAYFVGGISKYLILRKTNYLSFLGKNSIDVFVFHIPLVYFTHYHYQFILESSYLQQIIIAIVLIFILSLPAILREEIKLGYKKRIVNRIMGKFYLFILLPKDIFQIIWYSPIRNKVMK